MVRHNSLILSVVMPMIFFQMQLTHANKKKPCIKDSCEECEFCDSLTGKCTLYHGDCQPKGCPFGSYCLDGRHCVSDACGPHVKQCPHGEECYLKEVVCVRAPCLPIPACRPISCATKECPLGQICVKGKCVEDQKCKERSCVKGNLCYNGNCYHELTPCNKCGPLSKCYIGSDYCSAPPCPKKLLCRPDLCAVVRCAAGTKCVFGKCVPINDCL